MRRPGIRRPALVALALGLICAATALAAGVTLGPKLPHNAQFGKACMGIPEGCTYFNTKFENGRLAKAPFTGKVTSWKIQGAEGSFRLQVIRKRPSGTFKVVREGPEESINTDEVVKRNVNLKIARGDYVGVMEAQGSDFSGSDQVSDQSCFKALVPSPGVGGSAPHNPGFAGCGQIVLYNARITD